MSLETQINVGERVDTIHVSPVSPAGIINIHAGERNGRVAGVAYIEHDDELMLITQEGKILRMVTADICPIDRLR